ncbi:hypothetical protein WUBG_03572 [Wuchereria bancrofti]|uniref:Uncharacterized protein n=1 Tax=Wuchereria bancrofti TaxID=6293 RepID=J9BE57_WUCBA|nr:hypothetical protein WUBG_03572 [Wuchereria bancrofti]
MRRSRWHKKKKGRGGRRARRRRKEEEEGFFNHLLNEISKRSSVKHETQIHIHTHAYIHAYTHTHTRVPHRYIPIRIQCIYHQAFAINIHWLALLNNSFSYQCLR